MSANSRGVCSPSYDENYNAELSVYEMVKVPYQLQHEQVMFPGHQNHNKIDISHIKKIHIDLRMYAMMTTLRLTRIHTCDN